MIIKNEQINEDWPQRILDRLRDENNISLTELNEVRIILHPNLYGEKGLYAKDWISERQVMGYNPHSE